MKTTIMVFCLLCATAVFAQNGPILSNTPAPVVMAEHPLHASEHAMAQETSLFGGMSPYTYAKGEVPLAELGSLPYETPLGDVARAYRKEHAEAPKATVVLDK
ncbi:MAG: hypothetical protein WAK89_16650 [Candidatus Sulfotelmatobacter sp.]